MAIFNRSVYKFKTNDDKMVSLLANYVGNLDIGSISPSYGAITIEGKKIKDLPGIVAQIKSFTNEPVEIVLTTSYSTNESLRLILPKFDPKDVAAPALHLQSNVDKIISQFKFYNSFGFTDVAVWPSTISPMTQEEAWQVLHLVHKAVPIESAVLLPKEKVIMGMIEKETFRIYYDDGENSRVNNIIISFDLDDGFSGETYNDGDHIKVSPIPLELNEAFNKWKQNNYIGPLFPIVNYPLKPQETPLQNTQKPDNIKPTPSRLTPVKNFLHAPTRYVFQSAALAGLLTLASCMLYFSVLNAVLLSSLVGIYTFAGIRLRNQYYKHAKKNIPVMKDPIFVDTCYKHNGKLNAAQKGYHAANSWTVYFKDCLSSDNWKYASYYGAGLEKGLSDHDKGKNYDTNKFKKPI